MIYFMLQSIQIEIFFKSCCYQIWFVSSSKYPKIICTRAFNRSYDKDACILLSINIIVRNHFHKNRSIHSLFNKEIYFLMVEEHFFLAQILISCIEDNDDGNCRWFFPKLLLLGAVPEDPGFVPFYSEAHNVQRIT